MELSINECMIKNVSRDITLASKVKLCDSFISQALGLMFRPKLKDEAYLFTFNSEAKRSLHMFFVFQSIDILFLNDNHEIVEIKKCLRPFSFYLPKKRSSSVIELPSGAVVSSMTWLGDTITFKNQ